MKLGVHLRSSVLLLMISVIGLGTVATVEYGQNTRISNIQREEEMTLISATKPKSETAAKDEVRPFHVNISDQYWQTFGTIVATKVAREGERSPTTTQGVQLATMQKLARYWANDYDWRKAEAKINSVSELHHEHRWAGHSFHSREVEGKECVAADHHTRMAGLVHRADEGHRPAHRSHGARRKGRGRIRCRDTLAARLRIFRQADGTRLGSPRIARAWTTLMKRLGYTKFVAQGGDWGNAVSEAMALQAPPELLGISTNMAATVPAEISNGAGSGQAAADLLTPTNATRGISWLFLQEGPRLCERDVAQAADALRDRGFTGRLWQRGFSTTTRAATSSSRASSTDSRGPTRDDILDNITMYWLTNTAISSARLYWDTAQTCNGRLLRPQGRQAPVVVTVSPTRSMRPRRLGRSARIRR